MKRLFNILFAGSLLAVGLASCEKSVEDVHYVPKTPVGKLLLEECPEVARMFRDTTFLVTVGVEETDLHIQTNDGYVNQVYIIKVDTNEPGVKMAVSMPNNSNNISGGWNRQTLTDMAARMDAPGERVAAMVNGDFWQMSAPINPRGPVHRGGVILSDQWDYDEAVPQQALSFIGVLDDGSMIIAERSRYEEYKDKLIECTGSGVMMLSNGVYLGTTYNGRDPRTAIGYTDDGIVWLLTCDGRQTFGAAGMTYKEMGYIFQTLGCVGAANLDGGGSAQMLIRHPIADVWQIRNRPSDGAERPVINGWAVIVEEP